MLNFKKAKKKPKFSVLLFNKEQKEGLARVSDTLAASAAIGGIIGWTGHSQISAFEILTLFAATLMMLLFSIELRSTR